MTDGFEAVKDRCATAFGGARESQGNRVKEFMLR